MKLYPNVTLFFSIWLISVFLVSFIGFSILPHSGKFNGDFFQSLANWDGGHFLGIAKNGYSEKFQYAFFPLYPITISVLHQMTGNYLVAAILISVAASFLGIQLLYKLADKKLSVIFAILFFPTSFYFLTVYSEGLFFSLVIASFYFFRKQKLALATIFAVLASSTRLTGLALAAGLIIEVLITKGISRKNWIILFSPLGFVLYCIYLLNQTGDPFYFITAEIHWQRYLRLPGLNFWESLKNLEPFNLLDLMFTVFGLGLVLRSFRFLPISYTVFGLVSVLIPLFTPSLSSMPRYLLPIFPIFILLALFKNQYAIFSYLLISIMLSSLFIVLFINGYWVS